MIKALWLTSWYPNKLDTMNGDFIQRHARAVSLFCKVHVIHAEADKKNELKKLLEISENCDKNLSETILLYRLNNIPLAGKIISYFQYLRLFKMQVQQYIEANGKPDIVHVHVAMKAGIIALWLKRKFNIPFIVTEHWTIYNSNAPDNYKHRGFLFRYYTKKTLRQSSAFLPVSNDLGNAVQKTVTEVPFTAIPNVADTGLFNYQSAEKKHAFSFVHISTLNYQKNPEGILRTYKKFLERYPETDLIIAGEAGVALKQYADTLNLPRANLLFTGLVSYAEVASILKKSEALIMFSRYENLPCVIIEALCCGLPVISTNAGGIPELINDSNGFLIDNEDEPALLNAMINMYEHYQKFNCKQISADAAEKFSYEKVGNEIMEIYKKVLKSATEQ